MFECASFIHCLHETSKSTLSRQEMTENRTSIDIKGALSYVLCSCILYSLCSILNKQSSMYELHDECSNLIRALFTRVGNFTLNHEVQHNQMLLKLSKVYLTHQITIGFLRMLFSLASCPLKPSGAPHYDLLSLRAFILHPHITFFIKLLLLLAFYC